MGLLNRKKKISVDFAIVDFPDKAESLVKRGVLVHVLLVPPQQGEFEDSLSAIYATPEAAREKAKCDTEVERFECSGWVSRCAYDLEYDRNDSSRAARATTVIGKGEASNVVYPRTVRVR